MKPKFVTIAGWNGGREYEMTLRLSYLSAVRICYGGENIELCYGNVWMTFTMESAEHCVKKYNEIRNALHMSEGLPTNE